MAAQSRGLACVQYHAPHQLRARRRRVLEQDQVRAQRRPAASCQLISYVRTMNADSIQLTASDHASLPTRQQLEPRMELDTRKHMVSLCRYRLVERSESEPVDNSYDALNLWKSDPANPELSEAQHHIWC